MNLSMKVLMAEMMVQDGRLRSRLMHSRFGTPSDRSHEGVIWPLELFVDVDLEGGQSWLVDGRDVGCRSAVYYVFQTFLSFWIYDWWLFLLFLGFLYFYRFFWIVMVIIIIIIIQIT